MICAPCAAFSPSAGSPFIPRIKPTSFWFLVRPNSAAAAEFGLTKNQKLVGLILGMNGLPALGLKAAQGAQIMNPFYWDLTDGTRAFAKRFAERHPQNNYPNDMQAGVYASVIHYLKAVEKAGGA